MDINKENKVEDNKLNSKETKDNITSKESNNKEDNKKVGMANSTSNVPNSNVSPQVQTSTSSTSTSTSNNTKECKIRFISKGIIYFEFNKDYVLTLPVPKDFDEKNKTIKITYNSNIGKPDFSYSIVK